MPIKDLSGQRFSRVVAIRHEGFDKVGNAVWCFACDCGKEFLSIGRSVSLGRTKSCGCFHREQSSQLLKQMVTKHGRRYSPEYASYSASKARCNNPNVINYATYGGGGVEFRFVLRRVGR